MNAKEILEECRERKAFMLQCLEERDELQAAALSSATASYEPATKSGGYNPNRLSKADRYLQAQERLESAWIKYLDSWKAAAELIDTLLPSLESLLLMYRYLSCYKWDDIAAKLELNKSYCYKLHTKALKMLEKIA